MTHIYVSKRTIIGSDNGLSPGRRQAIIWTNAEILFIRSSETNFNEIISEIHTFPLKKMHLKMSSAKRRPFWSGGDELKPDCITSQTLFYLQSVLSRARGGSASWQCLCCTVHHEYWFVENICTVHHKYRLVVNICTEHHKDRLVENICTEHHKYRLIENICTVHHNLLRTSVQCIINIGLLRTSVKCIINIGLLRTSAQCIINIGLLRTSV